MAQQDVQLDRETFSCFICLDLLKDPVAVPCGDRFCMDCIKSSWDEEDTNGVYSCPQCREIFIPRPALKKNAMLTALTEQLKTASLQTAPAGSEDVACDFCTGAKKALKLTPLKEQDVPGPSRSLEKMCPRHGGVKKMFCPTELDGHKDHNAVSAAAESTENQRELEEKQEKTHQEIQDGEKDVKLLQQEVPPEPEPTTRDEFLKYTVDVTLDVNTANTYLTLWAGNKKVSKGEPEPYPKTPERFTSYQQILTREYLTGRCYFEVEYSGGVSIAAAYETISRDGSASQFGHNDKSWAVEYYSNFFTFYYNSIRTFVGNLYFSRVGVYLDHSVGILSFYGISDETPASMTLLITVQATFTQPLYAGLCVDNTVEFVTPK